MTVYLSMWHSHSGFTILVSCSDELAVQSCLLLGLQMKVAKR